MKRSLKIYAAGFLAFSLGFAASLGFMTASFSVPDTAMSASDTMESASGTEEYPVLVIDAGHGGFDGGAQAADGTEEKHINLAIAQSLAGLAADYRVNVVMTRDGDYGLYDESSNTKKRDDLQNRRKIMEESGAVLTVSIHLNSYPQDTSVYGAQVFYPAGEQEPTADGPGEITSRKIAEQVQASMETAIPDGRERTAMKKSDVLLLQNPPCHVILVECGFLSSPEEAEKLKCAEYQQLLAEAVWSGIQKTFCFEKKEKIPVIDSTNKSA